MEEDKQNDASEEETEREEPSEIIEWERKHDLLCKKIFKLSEIHETLKYYKTEKIESHEHQITKESNPVLVKYLEQQVKEGEAAFSEIIDVSMRSIDKLLSRIFYFIDYIFLTNYQALPTSLVDVISQQEPEIFVKIEDFGEKRGPFFLMRRHFMLTGYPEEATITVEYTECQNLRITTRLTKMYPAPRVTYVLRTGTGCEGFHKMIRACPARLRLQEVGCEVVNYSRSFPLQKSSDCQVSIAIHVEPRCARDRVMSRCGFLVWAIDEYRKRKSEEEEGLVEYHLSSYFYTRTEQYRVQVRMRLNGRRKCGVTAEVVFLIGEGDQCRFDSTSKIEFAPLEIKVTVFNPDDLSQRIEKSVIVNSLDKTQMDIGNEKEVEELVTQDTLYYKVSVADVSRTNNLEL